MFTCIENKVLKPKIEVPDNNKYLTILYDINHGRTCQTDYYTKIIAQQVEHLFSN